MYERDPSGRLFGHDYAWFWDPNGKQVRICPPPLLCICFFHQEYAWNRASERSLSGSFSPISDNVTADTEYWLSYADFYTWEAGVIQFDDVEDLLFKIETTDWAEESRKLAAYNERLQRFGRRQWESVFARVFEGMDHRQPAPVPETYEEGMRLWAEKALPHLPCPYF